MVHTLRLNFDVIEADGDGEGENAVGVLIGFGDEYSCGIAVDDGEPSSIVPVGLGSAEVDTGDAVGVASVSTDSISGDDDGGCVSSTTLPM